ncbi:hypothetical protein N7462_000390 [Penicillium macrosclerotiorum]|uniref:uncharacterized protein n=1 Tax=Penicillium macrosclerotiorum TaxID=303699 RepID=UPI0025486363|nr:uncharacterized protein N7462_000390 [Penicillium macrosclerotiorum]KAJ5698385.1 hypothetical protein N7462_000390 [Penicillium macrosclerotiorum]
MVRQDKNDDFLMDLSKGIVGWADHKDPQNPRNYAPSRKWFLLSLVSLVTLISPFASSVFSPAASFAAKEFNETSSILTTLTVTSYLFGYAVGPLVLSPLSELYGRQIVLNSATSFFVLFQIGCALAPNTSALIVFRALTGMGGSACLTTGGGVVADLFVPEQRGLAMSFYGFGPLFGPVLGPVCGGFIAQNAGWRWVFWTLTIASGTFTTFVIIFNRETNPVILMERKTKRLRVELGLPELRSCYDKDKSENASKIGTLLIRLRTPLYLLIRSPIVLIIAIYIAIVYGCLYLLFTTVTDVFQNTYHWGIGISGLSYLGLGLGFITGQLVFGLVSDKLIIRQTARNNDVFEPEMRLPLCILYALAVPISFFWYGWAVNAPTHWIVPIIGLFPFGFGMVGIFGTLQTYVIDSYPRYAASGIAAITVTRSLFGALLPLAGPYMYDALGYGWGNSLLGFVTIAMLPMPVIFHRFGRSLRERNLESFK